jgi:predicted phosphohydrolase
LIDGINAEDPDVVLILGDHSHGETRKLEQLFGAYRLIRAPLLLTMGNHDYWVTKSQLNKKVDSGTQRERFINLTMRYNFFPLDFYDPYIFEPAGDVAFVGGSMWYDYSFKPAGVTDEQAKLKCTDKSVWNDVNFVKWKYESDYNHDGFPDKAYSDAEIKRLEWQFTKLQQRSSILPPVKTIISATHFLPFKECVKSTGDYDWDYFNAFMGSEKIGQTLVKNNVSIALYGHSHSDTVKIDREFEVQGVKCYNVAYSKEQPFLTLTVP